MLRTREVPTAPLVLYAVGAIPISLRAFVPEAVLDLGLAVLAVGIAWLAIWLFTALRPHPRLDHDRRPADTPRRRLNQLRSEHAMSQTPNPSRTTGLGPAGAPIVPPA